MSHHPSGIFVHEKASMTSPERIELSLVQNRDDESGSYGGIHMPHVWFNVIPKKIMVFRDISEHPWKRII